MEEIAGFVQGAWWFSIVLFGVYIGASGVSIFAARTHPILGAVLDFFSRGFVFLVAAFYVIMIFPRVKFISEEFGLTPSSLFLIIGSAISMWFIAIPVVFLMLTVNSVILGLVSHRNKDFATYWSGAVSAFVLLCCLIIVFTAVGQGNAWVRAAQG